MTVSVVIGASSGLGEAIARRIGIETSSGSDDVVIGGDQLNCDVTNFPSVDGFIGDIIAQHGRIDELVFSAGVNELEWFGSYRSERKWDNMRRVIDVNLTGFLRVMDVLCDLQPVGLSCSVVAISSDAAERPLRTSAAYCASKAGLNMAVRCAAREMGPMGWRVNAVAPGMCSDTDMTEYIDNTVPDLRGWSIDAATEYEKSQEVVKGRILPAEVAQTVISTLRGPRHLNGSIITLNGGR